jgi:hypothetical protein
MTRRELRHEVRDLLLDHEELLSTLRALGDEYGAVIVYPPDPPDHARLQQLAGWSAFQTTTSQLQIGVRPSDPNEPEEQNPTLIECGGGHVRQVPLADQAATALERASHRTDFVSPDDYVFCNAVGRRLDGSALRRRYELARNSIGMPAAAAMSSMETLSGASALANRVSAAARTLLRGTGGRPAPRGAAVSIISD